VKAFLFGSPHWSGPILRFARERSDEVGEIRLLRGDAFHLPCADGSVDYVLCSLAFHHFGSAGCVAALREMERVARHGWLVNDLRRARSAWLLIRAISALLRMNRMTRHDGAASVLRAYTVPEYSAFASAVGLRHGRDFVVRGSPFYRVAIIRDRAKP
jgi:ubiquinone/menaquinone biosynthesis C-methylase UbiE